MIDYRFYDTSSLLAACQLKDFLETDKPIVISSITLKELENIKSSDKSSDVKYAARRLTSLIDEHPEKFIIHVYTENMMTPIKEKSLPFNDDMRILATALDFDKNHHPDEVIFVSNDISLRHIANLFFGNGIIEKIVEPEGEDYTGFKSVYMTEQEMSDFYSNLNKN